MVTKYPRGIRLFFSHTVAWYTNHDACCSFLCGNFCGSLRARARDDLPAMSRHTTSKAQREKPAFSDRGAESFLWFAFLSGNSFFRAGFCGVARAWKGPFPVAVSIMEQERKAASPASASPWRTPANRCRTRLFSAPNSPAFRGSQQPLGAFPLEEPGAIFPHPAVRIDKEKGPWYNVHDPTRVALVFACWLAQGLFSCHQAAPGRMTRDGR